MYETQKAYAQTKHGRIVRAAAQRRFYIKDRQNRLIEARVYQQRPEVKARRRERYKERRTEGWKPKILQNAQYRKIQGEKTRLRLKLAIIRAYGGKCACCGEKRDPFLTLEHIYRNGAEHRKKLRTGDYRGNVYMDLKRRGFPQEGYAILCWNCNCATSFGKTCPHKLN